jgi:hypothetical protein
MARVNLPHIGNRKCIIFFLQRFFLTIFKVLPFSVEIGIYMHPSDIKFHNSEYAVPGLQSSYQQVTIKNRMISPFQLCFLQFAKAIVLFQG